MFLETLLSARERLTLSYVARDAVTGEPRAPSSVVEALLELAEPNRARRQRPTVATRRRSRARPPLARHEDPAACAVIPAAARERQAAALGASLRRAGGGVLQLPPLASCAARSAPDAWASVAAASTGSRRRRARSPATRAPPRADARRSAPLPRVPAAGLGARAAAGRRRRRRDGRGRGGAARARAARRGARRDDPVSARRAPGLLAEPGYAARPRQTSARAAYDRAAAIKRLDGTLPDGLFGRALRERHLGLLRCWRDGLLRGDRRPAGRARRRSGSAARPSTAATS